MSETNPIIPNDAEMIILIQFDEQPSSKSYIDVVGADQFFESILNLFETQVRTQHHDIIGSDNITYDYKDVVLFLSGLKSISVLIFDKAKLVFAPKDLDWIKQQLIQHLHVQGY